ncbi:MAG TPA: FAD-dependent oxidoreductase [Chloroflexota bacterium]
MAPVYYRTAMAGPDAEVLVIGGGWPGVDDPGASRMPVTVDSVAGSAAVEGDVLPALGGVRLTRAWAAMTASTGPGNRVGLFGECGRAPGLHLAVSSGWGFTLAPVLGRLVAERQRQPQQRGRQLGTRRDRLLRVDRDRDRAQLAGDRRGGGQRRRADDPVAAQVALQHLDVATIRAGQHEDPLAREPVERAGRPPGRIAGLAVARGERQREPKHRADAELALDAGRAAVQLDEPLADRQTEPDPAQPGRQRVG